MTTPLKLSVCIPAYNRPEELRDTLRSIGCQQLPDVEVVISEDCSPKASEIARIARTFAEEHPDLPVNFFQNETNLGYDGNFRCLLDRARGEYCLFLGDDDLLADGALERVLAVLHSQDVGYVLRAWKSVTKTSHVELESFQYFDGDRLFPVGAASVVSLYRRSVFISGLRSTVPSAFLPHTGLRRHPVVSALTW